MLDKCFIQSLCIFCEIKKMSPLKVIALFCREVEYCRIYAFFVLILLAQKCAGANCYAFCMSVALLLVSRGFNRKYVGQVTLL